LQETDINERFGSLANIQRRSCSVSVVNLHQVPLADSVWFFTPICWNRMSNRFCQISDDNLATSFDIRFCVRFVAFLLSNIASILCSKSVSTGLVIWVLLKNGMSEKDYIIYDWIVLKWPLIKTNRSSKFKKKVRLGKILKTFLNH